jgi:hypothetical protein
MPQKTIKEPRVREPKNQARFRPTGRNRGSPEKTRKGENGKIGGTKKTIKGEAVFSGSNHRTKNPMERTQ